MHQYMTAIQRDWYTFMVA